MKPKIWSECGCPREHRDTRDFVRCKFSRLRPDGVNGSGPWAAVTWCRPTRITLWLTPEQAQARVHQYNTETCGTFCQGADSGKHHVAKILPVTAPNTFKDQPHGNTKHRA